MNLLTTDFKLFGFAAPDMLCWIAAAVILLIVEANTATLTTIWFALGAIVAAVLAALGVAVEWQTMAFILASALFVVLTRPIVKKLKKGKSITNKDTLIGNVSYVTESINNIEQTGYIKINGVFWAARSLDNTIISEGTLVKVKAIKGNKLMVVLADNDE